MASHQYQCQSGACDLLSTINAGQRLRELLERERQPSYWQPFEDEAFYRDFEVVRLALHAVIMHLLGRGNLVLPEHFQLQDVLLNPLFRSDDLAIPTVTNSVGLIVAHCGAWHRTRPTVAELQAQAWAGHGSSQSTLNPARPSGLVHPQGSSVAHEASHGPEAQVALSPAQPPPIYQFAAHQAAYPLWSDRRVLSPLVRPDSQGSNSSTLLSQQSSASDLLPSPQVLPQPGVQQRQTSSLNGNLLQSIPAPQNQVGPMVSPAVAPTIIAPAGQAAPTLAPVDLERFAQDALIAKYEGPGKAGPAAARTARGMFAAGRDYHTVETYLWRRQYRNEHQKKARDEARKARATANAEQTSPIGQKDAERPSARSDTDNAISDGSSTKRRKLS